MNPLFLPACSVSILKVPQRLLSKIPPPSGHHNLPLQEWVQLAALGNEELRADLNQVRGAHRRRWAMMGEDDTWWPRGKTKLYEHTEQITSRVYQTGGSSEAGLLVRASLFNTEATSYRWLWNT